MIDFFEHIDAYKNHQLSKAEMEAFEKELLINAKLRFHVDHYELAKNISLGMIDAEVRLIAEQHSQQTKVARIRKWIWLAASVFSLFLLGYYYIKHNKGIKPVEYADIYQEPAWPITRSEEIDTLSDAIKIGLDGNVQAAVRMIKYTKMKDVEKNIWIAELFAKVGQADSTLFYLPKSPNDNKLVRDRINYLMILSYYKLRDTQSLNKEIERLPLDTDKKYKVLFDKIIL